MLETILIAMAICIDSFALGVTYGIKKIKIPKMAILTITLVTTCVLGISVLSGHIISQLVSRFAASLISSVILIGLGAFFMLEGYIKHLITTRGAKEPEQKLANIRIPKLGIIIDIALDVTKADLDISGDIDIKEALYIGFILSVDSLGVGFGYAMSSMNVMIFLALVFIINIITLVWGLRLGRNIGHYKTSLRTSLLPGFILIAVGILKWIM
jgi:putative sporulation protein YtaF